MVEVNGKKFYEVSDLQEMFHIRNPRTIYAWVKQGKIKGRKLAKKWLFEETEILRLLEGKKRRS